MRFRTPFVSILLIWLIALPALAHAETTSTRAAIRGVAHEFAVPRGWSTRASDAGIEFLPPGKGKRLSVRIVGLEAASGSDGKRVLGKLVEQEKQRKRHLRDATTPESIDFAGTGGQLVILSGKSVGGELEGQMMVVSIVGTTAYLFTCEGLIADMNAHVQDIAAIIAGVRPVKADDVGAPKDLKGIAEVLRGRGPSAEVAGDAPAPAPSPSSSSSKNGAHVAAEDFILADGAFGVKMKPLRFWRLAIAEDEYQLERTNEAPAAVLAIRRVGYASEKKYLQDAQEGGRSRQTRFAGIDALLVERRSGETIERTYHVLRGKYALVFEFRVVGRAGENGADARVFEIEQALVVDDKGVGSWSDGATELTTYGGVNLATTPGWKLASVGPGRANFRAKSGVEVEVRVRPWPASKEKDPFVSAEDAVKSRCGTDAYTRADAAVVGAASAVRFRCASKKAAQVVLVASGTARGGERVYVQVTAENPRKKGAPADAEIAEFGAYVALPH